MNKNIKTYLTQRQKDWLDKKTKNVSDPARLADLEEEAAEQFAPHNWIPAAAKRAKQLSLCSHPGKFTHPDAKISAIIAEAAAEPQGWLRTGIAPFELDCFGNAAAMDVKKFLDLLLDDGRSVLAHLEEESEQIHREFSCLGESFAEVRAAFLLIKEGGDSMVTSSRVKQIYFPVEDDYHLLSPLTPSGIMFALKERITQMHFSEEAKVVREARKKKEPSTQTLRELYDLTLIGFGGTKPQNISVLNNRYGGTAYLLPSLPPTLENRRVYPPRSNFFTDFVKAEWFAGEFEQLHKLLSAPVNNINIRKGRDGIFRALLYAIADRLWEVRRLEPGWSDSDNYQGLPHWQKLWLDEQYADRRQEADWFPQVETAILRWIANGYQQQYGSKALPIGDDDWAACRSLFDLTEEIFR